MDQLNDNKFLESYYPKVISEIKGFAIFMINKEGVISTWNEGCELMKEYKSEEAIGEHYRMLFPDFLKEKNYPETELREAEVKGSFKSENWRRKKSGELFWALVVLTKLTDEDGNFIGFTKITQDLTEKKKIQDELNLKNQKLTRMNQDLDHFVFTASHDLKTPIYNISEQVIKLEEQFKGKLKEEKELLTITNQIKQSVKNFDDIVREMALKSRQEPENEKIYLSFQEIVNEVKNTLNQEIRNSKAIIIENYSNAPAVRFSRKDIRTILHHLLLNSIRYRSSEKGPKILIQTNYQDGFTIIEVSDNGSGIKDEDKRRIFSMFNRSGEGEEDQNLEPSAVSLAIVARIVSDNGGKIDINSNPEEGKKFRIYIQ